MEQQLLQLESDVLSRRPALKAVMHTYGHASLFEYVQSWRVSPGDPGEILTGQAQELAAEIYGIAIGQQVGRQLRRMPLVSTIDHHGLLNHPFFLNSNLIASLRKDAGLLITFSTAGISLNNSSWPGCLVYHDRGQLHRVPLFRDALKNHTVLGLPPFSGDAVAKAASKHPQLEELLQICRDQTMHKPAMFWEQASRASRGLWNRFFPGAPQIVCLPIELLANRVITRLLKTGDPVFSALLLTSKGLQALEKNFLGIDGAFTNPRKGSFLFWGLREGRRVHLQNEANTLVGRGQNFPLTKAALCEALENTALYPTSLLCFMVMLYGNITCLGGFNQVAWLSGIRGIFARTLHELGFSENARAVEGAVTDNFAEGVIAFIPDGSGLLKASGVDIFLREPGGLYEKYCSLSQTVTLRESLRAGLPEMYRIVVPPNERETNLLKVSEEEVLEYLGLVKKIRLALS